MTALKTARTLALLATVLPYVADDALSAAQSIDNTAGRIFEATGTRGGLVVHLGCGDGKLTGTLGSGHSFLVHGLDRAAANVEKARGHIRSRGLYGRISVQQWEDARLPYVDDLVNLVVVSDAGGIPEEEILRAVAPGGAAYIRNGGGWKQISKPRAENLDDWTHYLHDPSNNAVARDAAVGPPRHMQWVGSPPWARHHDRMASMNALVVDRGRMYYVFDEGPTAAIMLPPEWKLIARDAFNGTVLWKKELLSWHPHLWPMKSGFAQLPRRIVAGAGKVYAPLGLGQPLVCMDGASGEVLRSYEGSGTVEEVILSEGVLFVLVNPAPPVHDDFKPAVKRKMWDAMRRAAGGWPWDEKKRDLTAFEAQTGKVLWERECRVSPLTLAADKARLYYHDGRVVVCLDRANGRERWKSGQLGTGFPKKHFTGGTKATEKWRPKGVSSAFVPASFGATLVVHGDTVLFAGGDDVLTGLSADSGKKLWTAEMLPSGHFSPQDVLVAGGLAWVGATAGGSGRHSGLYRGIDVRTGKVASEILSDTDVFFMHQRCYRSKATERYLIPSRTGTEFVDIAKKHWDINHWVRGGCLYGVVPCNGLLYAPPHSCACYEMAKLNGFNALAAASGSRKRILGTASDGRLVKGSAFGRPVQPGPGTSGGDWPTYRADPERSGSTRTAVPAGLKKSWETALGGRLSAVTVAGGKVFVSRMDSHRLFALDAGSGETVWTFTAGGRIDSPPTAYRGNVCFGCVDGWVYCLRATDGELVWKYRAAPKDYRLVASEQVESPWPVHGSVLVRDGALYCVAGRSMFLDGGMRLLKLDPGSGKLLYEKTLDDSDPGEGKTLQDHIMGHQMPVALPDVLSGDGDYLYMRNQRFAMDGCREDVYPRSRDNQIEAAMQAGKGVHLFSSIGFLDGSWWHRGYWVYGTRFSTGAGGYPVAGKHAPAGRILVVGKDCVYGYGRRPSYYTWTTPLEYRLFAAGKEFKKVDMPVGRAVNGKKRRTIPATRPDLRWSREVPLQARGMVLAGDTLLFAGPPDTVDEEKAFFRLDDEKVRRSLTRQSAALEGKEGALLCAVSAGNGETMATWKLASPPVWDGMAAAGGRLYIAGLDGRVTCLGKEGASLPAAQVAEEIFEKPDLVGYWKFDEGKGVVALDSSERQNDAAVHAEWTSGKLGSAVNFDGKSGLVEMPEADCLNITGAITISAWIKPDEQKNDLPMIAAKIGSQGKYIFRLGKDLHLYGIFFKGTERTATIRSDKPLSKDWHHAAVTCDPLKTGKLKLYVDGETAKSQDCRENWGDPAGRALTISGAGNQAFSGSVDEVRIYNRALSGNEIQDLAAR